MKRLGCGVVLIVLGVLFLLKTLGVWSGISVGSVLLALAGLALVWDGLASHRGARWFTLALGLWLGAIGVFNVLSAAGVTQITGGDIGRSGWPLLLIALGVSALLGRGVRVSLHGDRAWGTTQVVGDLNYGSGSPWTLDDDLDLHTAVGDLRLDLTTADISPGTHRIRLSQFVGETVVRVPDTLTVRAHADTHVGDLDILGETRSGVGFISLAKEKVVPDADAELIIEATVRIGSIRIEQVPGSPFRGF